MTSRRFREFKNSFFVRTISEWNQLEECQIRAETVNSFKIAVHKSDLLLKAHTPAVVDARIGFYRYIDTDTGMVLLEKVLLVKGSAGGL